MDAVLVVGGRTTGLMMACELARFGLAVRILDKSPAIDPHVRANLIHSRSLEIFQGLGLSEALTEGSLAEKGLSFYANGKLVAEVKHEPIDSPFPYGMSQSQALVERVLEARLATYGIAVERSVELVGLEQDANQVHATINHPDGRQETCATPWLVGCDGAHSSVRRLIACDFPGESDPYPYLLADVALEGDLADNEGHIFLSDAGELFVFSNLPGNRRLICANLARGDQITAEPTLAQFQSLLDSRARPGLRISDPRWLSHFHIAYRLAAQYRQGRVFLAGDAAHIHSLLAGQGMNVGIQDAYNLAWKLALVMRGRLSPQWLDSYGQERRVIAEGVVQMTREVTENTETFADLSAVERGKLLAHMIIPEHQRLEAAQHLQEVDVDYRTSGLCVTARDEDAFDRGPAPGSQAPDAAALMIGDANTTFYQLPAATRFRLLLFCGLGELCSEERVEQAAQEADDRFGELLEIVIVTAQAPHGDRRQSAVAQLVVDYEGNMHLRYGAQGPCLYLLRPDGYVAYRSAKLDGLGHYFSAIK